MRIGAALLFSLATSLSLCAQQLNFTIWKGDKLAGAITAIRKNAGAEATYAVSSYSELEVVTNQVVRTTMGVEYRAGRPWSCFTSLHHNGNLRDSTFMRHGAAGFSCYVHPRDRFILASTSPWCSARLYFDEPVGQTTVFVESVLRECPVLRIGDGVYKVELPGIRTNIYHYVDGQLREVQVDQPLVKLVFKRN